jgi:hypothetical protein
MASSDGGAFLESDTVAMLRMPASVVAHEFSSWMSLWRPSEEMEVTAAYRHRQQ